MNDQDHNEPPIVNEPANDGLEKLIAAATGEGNRMEALETDISENESKQIDKEFWESLAAIGITKEKLQVRNQWDRQSTGEFSTSLCISKFRMTRK